MLQNYTLQAIINKLSDLQSIEINLKKITKILSFLNNNFFNNFLF